MSRINYKYTVIVLSTTYNDHEVATSRNESHEHPS